MGFFGSYLQRSSGGGSSVATLGSRLAYASPNGNVAAAPAGFSSSVGRLLVTLTNNTVWGVAPGLTGGGDGQLLEVKVVAGNFTLTLPQTLFNGVADIILTLNNGILLYFDSVQGEWEVTSP